MAPSGLDEPPDGLHGPDADVVDALVEDGFKLLCVSAHYHMGVLLGGSLEAQLRFRCLLTPQKRLAVVHERLRLAQLRTAVLWAAAPSMATWQQQ